MIKRLKSSFMIVLLLSCRAQAAELRIGLEKWPGELHPVRSINLEAVLVDNQVFNTLVEIGPNGRINPVLVERWSYDPARRRFKFRLRNDVRFSNGDLLTSAHVLKAFSKIIAENRIQNFSRIKGALAFASRYRKSVAGLQAQGLFDFTIDLEVTYPKFLMDLADPYASIFLETSKEQFPLGTGPYAFTSIVKPNSPIHLTYNRFSKSQPPVFQELTFTADLGTPVDVSFAQPFGEENAKLKKLDYFDTEVTFLGFNAGNPSVQDLAVRRFFASLLTSRMITDVLGIQAYKLGGYIPFGMAGYDSGVKIPSTLLVRGLPKSVTVLNYISQIHALAVQYCGEVRKFGIKCRALLTSPESIFKAKENNSLQIFFLRQKSTTYSVEYLLSCFRSDSRCNLFLPADKRDLIVRRIDALLDLTLRTDNETKEDLLKLYREIDLTLAREAIVKPVRYGVNKLVWYSSKIAPPYLDTLGPFGIKFQKFRLKE